MTLFDTVVSCVRQSYGMEWKSVFAGWLGRKRSSARARRGTTQRPFQ